MKNVYFVQINDIYAGERENTYIPYAAGCIEAYCLQNPLIAAEYAFQRIIYRRDVVNTIVSGLQNPFMVLFSCSVWNTQFNLALARAIKEAFPACFITFGGHHVSSNENYLRDYPFLDFITHREGEESTEALLEHFLTGTDLAVIPNISFRDQDGNIVTTQYEPQTGIDYPSPYLTGVFDDILQDDIDFSVLLETNRGCPNACAYCDWGTLKSKIRLFPLERVFAEIDWLVERKIEFVYCTDANFCLFGRDEQIVDYIIDCNRKYGYPKHFHVNYTKNRQEFVFDVSSKLIRFGLSKAQTIALQSMSPEALKNVGRRNISADHYQFLLQKFAQSNVATYTELILGLPGETYASFCEGICALLENGQHFAINVYPCELIPNSEMGSKAYREHFCIGSTHVPFRIMHATYMDDPNAITEYAEFVTSTYSMSREAWADSLLFATYIQGLHNLGLLRAVAIYLRYAQDVSFLRFYQNLTAYSALHPELLLGRLFTRILSLCKGVVEGKNEFVLQCEDTDHILWGFDELVFLYAYKELDTFYAEITDWATETFGESAPLRQVVVYQHDIIKKIGQPTVRIHASYDYYDFFRHVYLNDPIPLSKKEILLEIQDKHPVETFAQFARETVWYGRNRREPDYTSGFYPVRNLSAEIQ